VRHWAGSLIAHGVLVLLLIVVRQGRDAPKPRATRIEIVDVIPMPAPQETPVAKGAGGGGAPAAPVQMRRASRPRRRPVAKPPVQSTPAAPEPSEVQSEPAPASEPEVAASEQGGGEGAGMGMGMGTGTGMGMGTGAGEAPIAAFERMVAGPRSKARDPILVYPKRERPVEPDRLFIAALTIDRDGKVVGARLVRGVGGARDEKAMDAVWRFAYLPALDDAGAPIRVRIEQQFMID
jgi:hypothetical protein